MLSSLDRLLAALFEPMTTQSPDQIAPDDRRIEHRYLAADEVGLEWMDKNGNLVGRLAKTQDTSDRGLSVLFDTPFEVGKTLWVTRDTEPLVKAVVRHVKPRGNGYLLGLVLVKVERRRTDRDPVAGTGTITWATSNGTACKCVAKITNANEFRVRAEVMGDVPVGTVATLVGDVMQCTGSVCYSTPLDSGEYAIGLHIAGKPRNMKNAGVPGAEVV